MSRIFFISGLGANELAFSNIGNLGIEKIMVKWIMPNKKESIQSYSRRLISIYGIRQFDYVAGLSFGGIIAQEISKIINNTSVILISSFRDKSDLKLLFRIALSLRLNKFILPIKIPFINNIITNVLNSGSAESRKILSEMIKSNDSDIMDWSIQKISELPRTKISNLTLNNIIGNKDRVVLTWRNDTTFIVEGGSHFMVFDNAIEVTNLIKEIINKNT